MFNSFYLLLFYPATLCFSPVFGEKTPSNPLQRTLSLLECYKFKQEGCENQYFLDDPEFSNCKWAAHNGTEKAATRYYLFTKENQDNPELLHQCGGEPPKITKFDPSHLLIIFPGFVSGFCHMAAYREMIYEYFKCHNGSIIGVEWTWGNSFDLTTAKENQKIVAKQIVIVIRKLKRRFNLTSESITCMGHSLGAHGCALVGKNKEVDLHMIHGLDPAGVVYWEDMPPEERLNSTDAKHVQVTHCNAGQCLFVKEPGNIIPQTYFAVNFTCGTRDVWYNDGQHQVSCYPQIIESLLKGDFLYALISLYPAACHHLQCLYYYKISMCPKKDCNYVGVECENPLSKEPQSENPPTESPVDVIPLARNLLGGNLQGQQNICGEECGGCTIVGANYNESDHSGGHKNYCINTTEFCDYCDKETYDKVKEECCSKNGNTPAETTKEPGICNTQ